MEHGVCKMTNSNEKVVLYKLVVKELKGRIVSGIYKKGDLLPSEKELMEDFNVSRITIRKALSVLADMGFIQTSQGRGSEVLFCTEDKEYREGFVEAIKEYRQNFMESTQIRLMLEPEAVRQVALTATDEQIDWLMEKMEDEEILEDSYEFHRTLISLLGNGALSDLMERLFILEGEKAPLDIIQPEKYEDAGKILEQHHRNILRAIKERNGEFAYFYMKEHTQYVTQMYEEYFELLEK